MVGQKIKKGLEMVEYNRITKVHYDECLKNMNGEMNLSVFEDLHNILDGSNGVHEDTHPDRVVYPAMDCHREFFNDKKVFMDSIIPLLVEKIEPTSLSRTDGVQLRKIIEELSGARDMIFLVWAAEQLLEVIRMNSRQKS